MYLASLEFWINWRLPPHNNAGDKKDERKQENRYCGFLYGAGYYRRRYYLCYFSQLYAGFHL
jgi:hypothetical protein